MSAWRAHIGVAFNPPPHPPVEYLASSWQPVELVEPKRRQTYDVAFLIDPLGQLADARAARPHERTDDVSPPA
jgi:hypothetical protein